MSARQVVARIDDRLTVKMIFRNEIGMFNKGKEGVSFAFRQVVPVITLRRKRLTKPDAEDDRSEMFQRGELPAVVFRKLFTEAQHGLRRSCHDHLVKV